jgi:hypothetical protein
MFEHWVTEFEVLMAMKTIMDFWVAMPCALVGGYQRFGMG